jgi:NADPH2:quinone reductase
MKAVLSIAAGGPETLRLAEIPEPTPAPGEVLLDVRACGVNFPDSLIIADKYQFRPERPFAPGSEVAGVVAALGEGVTGLSVGDRVIGATMWGGMAERVTLPAGKCTAMPDAMPFDEAACFLFTYGTSYHALKDRGDLKAGETLLVLGAAGGVGIAAVEIGKARGARVIAAASSQEKVAFALAHGADAGVVYPVGEIDREGSRALAKTFKDACGKDGANVIYDAVGGSYAEPALRAIAWEGRYLVVGFPAGIPRIPLNLPLLKSCQIVGVFWAGFGDINPAGNAANNRELLDLYTRGAVRPRISSRFPMERAGEAIASLEQRKAIGKVVVVVI